MSLHIRPIIGLAEFQAVLQLRRRIYVDELGYRVPLAADGSLPPERLDIGGTVFGAFTDAGELVGTVRVNYGDPAQPAGGFGSYLGFYGMQRFGQACPAGISIVTRLMVLPAHRTGESMVAFGQALYAHTRDHHPQIVFCIIDCVPALKGLFERIGYRQIGAAIAHPMAGTVLPMAFAVYDRAHFRRVGSPLLALCPRHDASTALWFEQQFNLAGDAQWASPTDAAAHVTREPDRPLAHPV